MSNATDLLPPNATELERDISQISTRVDELPVTFKTLWQPANCPINALPWLAWSLSVDEWDDNWADEIKRNVVAESIPVHRHKGTPGAIKRALTALGYTSVTIVEPVQAHHNGRYKRDGSITHGTDMHWAEFDVQLNAGISPPPDLAQKISYSIGNYKPARSHLRNLKYSTKFHNGVFKRDGTINRDGGYVNV